MTSYACVPFASTPHFEEILIVSNHFSPVHMFTPLTVHDISALDCRDSWRISRNHMSRGDATCGALIFLLTTPGSLGLHSNQIAITSTAMRTSVYVYVPCKGEQRETRE